VISPGTVNDSLTLGIPSISIDPSMDADPFAADAPREGSIYVPPSPSSRSLSHSFSNRSLVPSLHSKSSRPNLQLRQSSSPGSILSTFDSVPELEPSAPILVHSTSNDPKLPSQTNVQQRQKFSMVRGFMASRSARGTPRIVKNVKIRVDEIEAVRATEIREGSPTSPPSPTRRHHARNDSLTCNSTLQGRLGAPSSPMRISTETARNSGARLVSQSNEPDDELDSRELLR
jgi:hypothetical protein